MQVSCLAGSYPGYPIIIYLDLQQAAPSAIIAAGCGYYLFVLVFTLFVWHMVLQNIKRLLFVLLF
jgi:hypothetical protein